MLLGINVVIDGLVLDESNRCWSNLTVTSLKSRIAIVCSMVSMFTEPVEEPRELMEEEDDDIFSATALEGQCLVGC